MQDQRYTHNGRLTLLEWVNYQTGAVTYYYADQLQKAAKLYIVLSVLGSILSTPVVLLCWLPTVKSIKKTQKLVEEGDIVAARSEFRISFCCRLLGWVWCSAVSSILLVAVALGLTFAIYIPLRDS